MARITWQNVTAPDFETSRLALAQAGRSFSGGLDNLAGLAGAYQADRKDEVSQAALARLAQYTDPTQLQNVLDTQGIQGLGITDPNMINAATLDAIMSRPNDLLVNQGKALNNEQTALQNVKSGMQIDAANHALATSAFSRPHEVALSKLDTVAEREAYLAKNANLFAQNPMLLSDSLQGYIDQGGIGAQPEEAANIGYRQSTEATTFVNGLLNDPANIGLGKEALVRKVNNSNLSEGAKKSALAQLENKAESYFSINPQVADAVNQLPALQAAQATFAEQQSALELERTQNPMFDVLEYSLTNGEEGSAIRGSYTQLVERLNSEDNYYGNANGRVLNMVNDISTSTGVPKDIVAFAVLNNLSIDGRNLLGRVVHGGSDAIIRENELIKVVKHLTDPKIQEQFTRSYSNWTQRRDALNANRSAIEAATLEAGRAISQGGNQEQALISLNERIAATMGSGSNNTVNVNNTIAASPASPQQPTIEGIPRRPANVTSQRTAPFDAPVHINGIGLDSAPQVSTQSAAPKYRPNGTAQEVMQTMQVGYQTKALPPRPTREAFSQLSAAELQLLQRSWDDFNKRLNKR